MKSFREYLRLNESVVDQYLAVRDETDKSIKVVDEYHKTKKSGFLDTVLPGFFKPALQSSMPGQGVNSSQKAITPKIASISNLRSGIGGEYNPVTGIANSIVADPTQRDDTQYVIAHELAHSYQHNAQYRNRKVNKLPSRMLGDRKTPTPTPLQNLISEFGTKKSIIGGSIGAVAGAAAAASGAFDVGGVTPFGGIVGVGLGAAYGALGTIIGANIKTPPFDKNSSQYWNSDIEVNARAIGNSIKLLGGHAPDNSNPWRRMGSYNNRLANSLRDHPDYSSSDLISGARRTHLFRYSITNMAGEGLVTPENVKKGTNVFGRILQHHEEQLPSDLHTPEGREAFIRAHGS